MVREFRKNNEWKDENWIDVEYASLRELQDLAATQDGKELSDFYVYNN
jgi:hypothetical protein